MNMRLLRSMMILTAVAAAVLPRPASAGSGVTVFKAARAITMAGDEVSDPVIVVDGGRILRIGSKIEVPEGARIVDLGRATLMPGLVDANLLLILDPVANEEAREVTPRFRVVDGLDSRCRDLQRALQVGVTTAFVGPGTSNVVGGLGAVLRTSGSSLSEMVMVEEAALKVTMGSAPSRGNFAPRGMPPTSIYARRPTTRMGVAWEFRKAFLEARTYGQERPARREEGLEILLRATQGKLPVRITANRAMDIESAARIAEEFGLAVVFEEAEEAYRRIDLLRSIKARVLLRPSFRPEAVTSYDQSEVRADTFVRLARAGIPVALLSEGAGPAEGLLAMAAFATRYGAAREQALRAVTMTPAEILGVEDRVGSLAPGKDADFLVLNGDPLELTTRIDRVYVGGRLAFGPRD